MLHRIPVAVQAQAGTQSSAVEAAEGFDLSASLGFARRQWPTIIGGVALAVACAIIYLLVAQPRYLSTANLLLDTRKLQLFQQQSVLSDISFDTPAVESQIELLKSEAVAASVVDDLKLMTDPEFTGGVNGFFGSLSSALLRLVDWSSSDGTSEDPKIRSQEELTRAAIGYLRGNLQVRRIGLTYVIEIGFTSLDPAKAARVANALGEAYILDQTQSKQYTTKRATDWLQQRVTELRQQAVTADREVQDFRTKNNMIKIGATSMDEQQLADLSTQLSKAREQSAEAKARLDRIYQVIAARVPDASMTAWLQNEVISRLRLQFVDASRREADLSARLGPDHQAVVNARKEKAEIERSAAAELRRIAEGFKSEYGIAQAREQAVAGRLAAQTKENEQSRQENGALQVLESSAKAYQALHDSFLQRYVEASQQQSVTSTEARVISPASGASKVSPKTGQVMVLGSVLGVMAGCGAAYARERLNRVFRTPKQVEQQLGIECLGILPAIETRGTARKKQDAPSELETRGRTIDHELGIARQVVLTPFSRFTETVRSIKVAADTNATDVKVVGLVSAVPGEGKSTLTINLGQLAAHAGSRTLVMDADLRNPALTRAITPWAAWGLLEVLNGSVDVADVLWTDPITGLEFLPAVLSQPIAHTSELLASRRMAEVIAWAREQYDYVIMDLPPLAPVVDAKAAGHLIDAFVLVIQWGQTSQEVIEECLSTAEVVQSKIIGAALNRANPAALKRIEAYKGKTYHRYYGSSTS
jgi:succinoglycan biosynthesis transport protein ExoP